MFQETKTHRSDFNSGRRETENQVKYVSSFSEKTIFIGSRFMLVKSSRFASKQMCEELWSWAENRCLFARC